MLQLVIINSVTKPMAIFVALVIAAVVAIFSIPAAAQCANWDASGEWEFRQRGQSKPIKVILTQNGRALTGTAELPDGRIIRSSGWSFDEVATLHGTADGSVSGDRFSLHIFWQNGQTGVYTARVLPSGKLEGKGHEKDSPSVLVSWDSVGRLKCPPPPPPQPVVPKVIKSSGKAKVKPPPAQTRQPAPPPMKVPGIIAGPVIFPNAYAFTTFAAVQWDAGPDHPYAEVWLKVNNGDATFLVEQGKGGRQITVERGKVYEYILTDAGKTLATVTVVGQ